MVSATNIPPNDRSTKEDEKSLMTFEGRCEQLKEFKEEFGHCNVPLRYKANRSLGNWSIGMRYGYNHLRQEAGEGINVRPLKSFNRASGGDWIPIESL